MRLECALAGVVVALTLYVPRLAPGAEATPLSARISCRDDFAAKAANMELVLTDVATYYVAASGGPAASSQMLHSPALTFSVATKQPTQKVVGVSIPLSGMASIDVQWLPTPRSPIGFKKLLITMKDGGVQSVDMIEDGGEYRYSRKDKNGTIQQDIKGELALKMEDPSSPQAGGGMFASYLDFFGFRGIGDKKQRPHNSDNEWILHRELIDRIVFVGNAGANQASDGEAREPAAP